MASYRVIKNGIGIISIQKDTGELVQVGNNLIGTYVTMVESTGSLEAAKDLIQMYIDEDKEEELRNQIEVLYEVDGNE